MTALQAMYIVVGDKETHRYSYSWKIWWHGSSFYIKSRDKSFADFKVSLHGADAFHPDPGFIVGRDQSATKPSLSRTLENGRFLGSRFPGRKVADGVLHVATLRFGAELFAEGSARLTLPSNVKVRPSITAHIAVAPSEGEVTDVHLYLSKGRAYVQHGEKARAANAIFGPLRNTQDEYLTGLVNKCSLARNPSPPGLIAPLPYDEADRVRGFSSTIDPTGGFLWIAEQWLSQKELETEAEQM
ncbi:hypothetical protein [Arthrobacter antibioticus]|uniref:hypothetical protein n=1 Tax=Arthrobacter sp. H35-MC1 TaxID=3046203 RepID=UPI0024BBC639|nr:hypothetical protein [Arthrobacter sp. H35-MC1]MDJ0317394.1 hypothetical protein [Arthrobacter sp. H35-MC1]